MMEKIHQRLHNDEGFTLVELMVVVLIIAILMAIAIPTFLGARQKAQDRAAQSNLRNALTAEKVYYVDNEKYTSASLSAIEPGLTWQAASYATTSSDAGDVHMQLGNTTGTLNDITCLTALSASGTLFAVKDIATGTAAGTYYKNGGTTAETACNATAVTSPWSKTGW